MSTKDEEAIFSAALEIADQAERQAYLARACREDTALRAGVDALLRAHESQCLLDVPVIAHEDPPSATQVTEEPGTVIGRYKLLERIGEGGMAIVYMAEQREPILRKVAVKIIKLGMDTKQVVVRFEAERQALAIMDHPNIAKVFDGGATETGRPFFVMELVMGMSVTEYCDKNHLSTKERLGLFAQVCSAIQHAHQKGIIHRDIKPSNVMVTMRDGQPVPKVIDFGIAKAINQRLTEKTLFTRYAQVIGTPAYMSPEQAEMTDVDIDTRSDIYSLGVLLYELLTGTTPFSEKELREVGYAEIQRVIREEEPAKPSTKLSTLGDGLTEIAKRRSCAPDLLRRALRGDLDWIVMKALEKERARRYDSASALLDDVQRHLSHEPVSAGPPTALYRMKKFMRRRRGLVVGTVAVLIVMLIGLCASSLMYLRADRARSETERVSDFFTEDLLSSIYPEKAKGQEVTVRYFLDHAAKNIDNKLADSPLSEAKVQGFIGLAYQKLGEYAAAEPPLQRALQIRREQLGEEDPTTLSSLSQLGRLYTLQGEYEKAKTALAGALAVQTRVLGEEHRDTLRAMTSLAELYMYRAQFEAAYPLLMTLLDVGKRVLGEEHPIVLDAMLSHAYLRVFNFQADRAYALASKGLEISRRALGEEHEITLGFMSALVCTYRQQERYDEGKVLSAKALEIGLRVFGEEHPATLEAMSQLGDLYVIEGRLQEAAPLVTKAVEFGRRVLGPDHVWTLFFTIRLVRLYEAQGQFDEMEALISDALETSRRMKANPGLTGYFAMKLRQRITERSQSAQGLFDAGEYGEAFQTLNRIADLRIVLGGADAVSSPSEVALLATSLHRLGRDQEAIPRLNQLRAMLARGEYVHEEQHLFEAEQAFTDNESEVTQAWTLIQSGKLEEASTIVDRLQASTDDYDPYGGTPSLTEALARAYCYRASRAVGRGEYEKAIDDYNSSLRSDSGFARAHERLARLLCTCRQAAVRDGVRAVEHAAKACELTAWRDTLCLATLAAAHAEAGDFQNAVKFQGEAIALLDEDGQEDVRPHYEMRLARYETNKPYHKSMVAQWTFDQSEADTVFDKSGNGLNGRLAGDAHIVEDPDGRGRVLRLDGEGDWVDCGNDENLSIASEISVACWTKVNRFDKANQTFVSKGKRSWSLCRATDTAAAAFACYGIAVPGNGYGAVYGKTSLNDQRWHHLVGVYDGTRISLYVDGRLDVSSEASGNINMDACRVFIGENNEEWSDKGQGVTFNGFIDDVRIYDHALTEFQIKALWNGEETEPPGGTD